MALTRWSGLMKLSQPWIYCSTASFCFRFTYNEKSIAAGSLEGTYTTGWRQYRSMFSFQNCLQDPRDVFLIQTLKRSSSVSSVHFLCFCMDAPDSAFRVDVAVRWGFLYWPWSKEQRKPHLQDVRMRTAPKNYPKSASVTLWVNTCICDSMLSFY